MDSGQATSSGAPLSGDTTVRTPPGHVLPLPAPLPSPAPATEERLGGYRLERVLGRGGMGVVWLAESVALRRKVALKVLTAHGDPELVERFLIEARAAARIDHPHVVRVHEVGRDGARWFLAMDLVDGESLRARVQREGALEPREAARIVEAIGRALHHAHALGVLHRDVKPHNVLLGRDGAPRLADFGLAKLQGDATSDGITATGAVIGTPAYMAPEQAQGDLARVDRRTDVYALGATLYEALTGRPPFEGPTAVNILHQVFEMAPVPPSRRRPGLDRDLETICLRALEKDPGARYDTAAALADDLGRWERGEPIVARRAGLGERAAKWARRRPAAATVTVLVAAASIAMAVALAAAHVERVRAAAEVRHQALARAASIGEVDSSATGAARSERLGRALEALEAVRHWSESSRTDEARSALAALAREVGDQARELEQYSTATLAYTTAAAHAGSDEARRARDAAVALERGHLYRRTGDATDARRELDVAAALQPRWVQIWVELAETANLEGNYELVDGHLATALELRPADAGLWLRRALTLNLLARQSEALRHAQRAAEAQPELFLVWLTCADLRFQLRDFAGALEDCRRALEAASAPAHEVAARALRARVLLSQGATDDALVELVWVTELDPDSPDAWARLGQFYRHVGREADAQAALGRALELAPSHEGALLERALATIETAPLAERQSHLDAALRLRPQDPQLLMRCAWLSIERHDARSADEAATMAVGALNPRSLAEVLVTRAAARRMLGQHVAAEADASAALILAPRYPHAWIGRGTIRAERGDVAGAIADLERFLQLDPGSPEAPGARQRLAQLRAVRPR